MNLSRSIQLYRLNCTKCYQTDNFLNTPIIPFNDFGNDVLFSKKSHLIYSIRIDSTLLALLYKMSVLLFAFFIELTISSISSRVSADFSGGIFFFQEVQGWWVSGRWRVGGAVSAIPRTCVQGHVMTSRTAYGNLTKLTLYISGDARSIKMCAISSLPGF